MLSLPKGFPAVQDHETLQNVEGTNDANIKSCQGGKQCIVVLNVGDKNHG